MSTREKLIEARISLLALADELQNISRACKVARISRSHFYEIKDAFEKYGRDGLAPQPRRRPPMPNQTPPELEAQILPMMWGYASTSYVKIADSCVIGVPATPNQVRGLWLQLGDGDWETPAQLVIATPHMRRFCRGWRPASRRSSMEESRQVAKPINDLQVSRRIPAPTERPVRSLTK